MNPALTDLMPERIYVFNDAKSIGDLGFTRTDMKDNHVEYIRADLVPAVTDDAKRAALEWFEDLVTCSKLVSGQEPQARYIRAGILSGFYEVPSFGVDYLFNNTCSGLCLFDSKDGGDSKTMESHVRARFLQLLNWIAYNYPKGIKVVK